MNAAAHQPAPQAQPLKAFPVQPHVTSGIAGPLFIEGHVDAAADRSIKTAIMLPHELDAALPAIVGSDAAEADSIDTITVHNDSSVSNDSGVMQAGTWLDGSTGASTNISGLGLSGDLSFGAADFPGGAKRFAGGITFRNVEVAEVLLGQGDDRFTINDTLKTTSTHGGITLVHGGGNTSEAAGDTIIINGVSSALVVYGDTAQDGARYGGVSGVASSLGISFAHSGSDVIDARNATGSVTIYGGAGDDTITGGQAGDHLFGGSGNDTIDGQGGNDHIYGDSGIKVDANSRIITVVTANGSAAPNHDSLLAGRDTLSGGSGDDILFGDHGRIDQAPGTLRILGTGSVTAIAAVEAGNGAADIISGGTGNDVIMGGAAGDDINAGEGSNIVFGDHGTLDYVAADGDRSDIDLLVTTANAIGGDDRIVSGAGDDIIVGGVGADVIDAGAGANLVFGDNARIEAAASNAARFGSLPVTLGRVLTLDPALGGADSIRTGAGNDVVFGGNLGDTIDAGDGNNIVLGDDGVITWTGAAFGGSGAGDDLDPSDIDQIVSTSTGAAGGADSISTGAGQDIVIGGRFGDTIAAGGGDNLLIGDSARISAAGSGAPLLAGLPVTPGVVESIDVADGGADIIGGSGGRQLVIGGAGGDDIRTGAADDIVLGDNGLFSFVVDGNASSLDLVTTIADAIGGADVIRGEGGDDVLVGGAAGDRIDGGSGRDLVFGDNVSLDRTRGDGLANPRYRTLSGTSIHSTAAGSAGSVLVTGAPRAVPGGAPVWEDFDIQLLDHDRATEASGANSFGNDSIAGGAGNDQIFGQLGDDVIQGDGSIDITAGARRLADGTLSLQASVENLATDGDDYIEGNGGNDVIFGNLGQDDIIGGSSSLFSLTSADRRTDGADLLFGGAGTDVALTDAARLDMGDTAASGHANDSDMLLGDNGNIYRLVGVGTGGATAPLQFGYDQSSAFENRGSVRIVVRAADLLDYTPGGADVSAAALGDIGAADEIHGESGDDFIYGMKGSDVLFGEGQDDDIIGGYGNDWISGGTGQDGVIGDDGRIFTSRNGTADPLNGVLVATQQSSVSTPGGVQQADLNVTGQLKKAVDLSPFSQDTAFNGTADEFGGVSRHTSDDIIYGGLGSDFLHGGSGDDAVSGAEAQWQFYARPANGGNVLGYNPATTEFAAYDEYLPRTRIEGFLLNFNANEGPTVGSATWGAVQSDGDDKLFGDTGNDWLVGGTGRDDLYGGFGDDLLNADDRLDTTGGTNDAPDTHPSYEDRAFGGAGRDVLIANTGGDRLIDWAGEYNSYIVPFAPFGMGTVSRTLQPQLAEFLYALSASDGADMTRAADTGSDPARNGEPQGELGLVRQQDFAWQDQTGGPRDPQPGNIGGGKRDVLRSASFDDPTVPLSGFAADSGKWDVNGGRLEVSATSPQGDAASVFQIGDALPSYFEMQATVSVLKPTGGWKANGYLIFDYVGKTDFKFAGIDVSTNRLVIGHRTADGWVIDSQTPFQAKPDTSYNLMLTVNGLSATISVDNKASLARTYAARVVDGYSYGLNWGLTGVGADSSRGSFDNVTAQVIAPQATTSITDEFSAGTGTLFAGQAYGGSWNVSGGRLAGAPSAGSDAAIRQMGFGVPIGALSLVEFSGTLSTSNQAGVVFDRYGDNDYKFVLLDAPSDQVLIGHRTAKGGVVIDAAVARRIDAGADYTLGVTLKGATVNVTLGGQAVLGYAFNAALADGGFGLVARGGSASFDAVTLRTNDAAAAQAGVAKASPTLATATLAAPQQVSVASAVLAPEALAIDWGNVYQEPAAALAPSAAASGTTDWRSDFVTGLGRSEAERNPNASLRVQVNVAPKVKPELSVLNPAI
jgi:Ca2+-binding RTX toxin-like protein